MKKQLICSLLCLSTITMYAPNSPTAQKNSIQAYNAFLKHNNIARNDIFRTTATARALPRHNKKQKQGEGLQKITKYNLKKRRK